MTPPTRTDGFVERPNPVCMAKIGEASCGYCVFTITEKEIFVGELPKNRFNKKGWKELKRKSVLFPAQESYAPLKAFAINSCKEMGSVGPCENIAQWRVKLDSLDSISAIMPTKPELPGGQ